jgi:3-dehydroquinate dehydratase type I
VQAGANMDLYIRNLKLGEFPLIAGVLTDRDVFTIKDDSLDAVDIVELRVDMFDDLSHGHIKKIFETVKDKIKKPVIATIRDVREGGQRQIEDRLSLYKIVTPLSDLVDIEIISEDILTEIKKVCTAYKKLLIASYHNFESTPDDKFLKDIAAKGKRLGADIVKIAATANDREDLIRLMTFTLRHRDKGLITMSMGDKGLPSRILSPLLGSLITYGYITTPSAPGQLSATELMNIFRRLKIR